MTETQKAALLDWVLQQEQLKTEVVRFMGGKQVAYVWLDGDEQDFPSGKGPTMLEALQAAKTAQETEAAR